MGRPTNFRALLWLIGVSSLLVALGLSILQHRLELGSTARPFSTFRADPRGARVLFQSLRATAGYQVYRQVKSDIMPPGGSGHTLVMLGVQPEDRIQRFDSRRLARWVQSGGTFILAFSASEDATGILPKPGNRTTNAETASWSEVLNLWNLNLFKASQPKVSRPATAPLLDGPLEWQGSYYFADSGWRTIASVETHPIIVQKSLGQGQLIVLADSSMFANAALARATRATALVSWLFPRSEIYFDETHLGIAERPGIVNLFARYHLLGTIALAFALAGLFIWASRYRLRPLRSSAATGNQIAGRSGFETFVNLLKRSIPTSQLYATCTQLKRDSIRLNRAELNRWELGLKTCSPAKSDWYNSMIRQFQNRL